MAWLTNLSYIFVFPIPNGSYTQHIQVFNSFSNNPDISEKSGVVWTLPNYLGLGEFSCEIHESKNGMCKDDAIADESGPQRTHICLPSSWLVIEPSAQDQALMGWSDCPACPKSKAGRLSLASLSLARSLAVMNSNCAGNNSDLQNSSVQMHTLLPRQRRSPHPFGASLCEESGLGHTQSQQLCF